MLHSKSKLKQHQPLGLSLMWNVLYECTRPDYYILRNAQETETVNAGEWLLLYSCVCVCCMHPVLTLLLCIRPLSVQGCKCTPCVHCRGTEMPQVHPHLAAVLSETQCCSTLRDMQLNPCQFGLNIHWYTSMLILVISQTGFHFRWHAQYAWRRLQVLRHLSK